MAIDDLEDKRPRQADESGTHVYFPDQPDWNYWKQREGCRLWCAVLLSMNIEPSVASREALRVGDPDKYKNYKKRLKIVNANCRAGSVIPPVEHPLSGIKPSERWVLVSDVLKFGIVANWPDIYIFDRGLTNGSIESGETLEIDSKNTVEDFVFDDLPKGERYSILRFGALLKLVETWMLNDSYPNRAAFLNGNQLNYSAIGKEMERILSKKDQNGKLQPLVNFRYQSNSKKASEAVKAVQTS